MALFMWIYTDEYCVLIVKYIWELIKIATSKYKRRNENDLHEKYKNELDMLLEGSKIGLNLNIINNNTNPDWLDKDKIRKGQQFGKSYFASINYSNLISLYLLFAHERSLRPLIYTNRSSDISSAYKRYMSTIKRVQDWFEQDLFDEDSPARKHIKIVNNYHCKVSNELNSMDENEFLDKSNLNNDINEKRKCYKLIQKDLIDNGITFNPLLKQISEQSIHLSQSHMVVTQFGFMGLVVLYPNKFGITCKEDLENYIHLWRYLGYLLGIEDKYNLCDGSYEVVIKKSTAVLECFLKPCLTEVGSVWEHMSFCAFQGINTAFKRMIFESTLLFLFDCIDVRFDNLYNSLTFSIKYKFYCNKYFFKYGMRLSSLREFINDIVVSILKKNYVKTKLTRQEE